MAKKVLSGAKAIRFTLWDGNKLAETSMDLDNVIGDTVAISQDDPETNDIECETRDEPIYSATKQGKINITMDSADVNGDILVKCMNFTEDSTNNCFYAPKAYVAKYAQIEVEFDDDKLVLPRVLLNSKFDASTLKTGSAKGTIAGTAYTCEVHVGANSEPTSSTVPTATTPFFVVSKKNGSFASWKLRELGTYTA